jgi:DNA repair protein NreA
MDIMSEDIKFQVIKKIAETNFKYKGLGNISKIDSTSPPSVFIGSKLRYPMVNVGILSPLDKDENAWVYDNEKYWANNNFQINDVLKLRNSLLNSRFQSKVQDSRLKKRFVQIAQDIAIASKPVDVEIQLRKNLNLGKNQDRVVTPHGMHAGLKQAKITGNVKVDNKIDKVMNDEIKASEGIEFLYKNEFTEYSLSKILSVGALGLKKDKRLVPTRWSITATDDTLGKFLLKNIREYKWIENYELFMGEFLGNQYLILFFPSEFNYELFELYMPKSSWNPSNEIKASTDSETYSGRKTYASNTAGGYYATRLPILEYLNRIKRQASVLAIRIETPTYWAGLGVWVVRESVRKSLNNEHFEFDDMKKFVETSKILGNKKFNFNYSQIIDKSKVIKQITTQKNLSQWF